MGKRITGGGKERSVESVSGHVWERSRDSSL